MYKTREGLTKESADVSNIPDGWRKITEHERDGIANGTELFDGAFSWKRKESGEMFCKHGYTYIKPITEMPMSSWCVLKPEHREAFMANNPGAKLCQDISDRVIFVHKLSNGDLLDWSADPRTHLTNHDSTTAKYTIPGVPESEQIHLTYKDQDSFAAAIEAANKAASGEPKLAPPEPKKLKKIPEKCYICLNKSNVQYFLDNYDHPNKEGVKRSIEQHGSIEIRDLGFLTELGRYKLNGYTEVWMSDLESSEDVVFAKDPSPPPYTFQNGTVTIGNAPPVPIKDIKMTINIDEPSTPPQFVIGDKQYVKITKDQRHDAIKMFPKRTSETNRLVDNGIDLICMTSSGYNSNASGEQWYIDRGYRRIFWHDSEAAEAAVEPEKIKIKEGHYIVVTREQEADARKMLDVGCYQPSPTCDWLSNLRDHKFVVISTGGWMPDWKTHIGDRLEGEDYYKRKGYKRQYWHPSEAIAPPEQLVNVKVDVQGDKIGTAAGSPMTAVDAAALASKILGENRKISESEFAKAWREKIGSDKPFPWESTAKCINTNPVFPNWLNVNSFSSTPPKEISMLTREEELKILAFINRQNQSTPKAPGLVRKTAGVTGGLLKWALLTPAKSLVRPGLKLLQYGVFFAAVAASGYTGWQLSKKVEIPSFQSPIKWEASSPSDKAVAN